ncbi:MAG: YbhB/YbcL family Raf kinase inhibitor-like protein [Sandaracinus sp.]|nr:YbhB/YbcL family Raf kinase inhibitor-like protein [Sandaracinus sp.]MCB9616971.1 YbhB/YbcL family Raf kinase inhibitor-like protein [Sandaracinus sp.]MCB9634592.1 YbhB/YbcL family Raf kinase inhibitor-like protein [Sandaracinus sp.]
MPQRLFVSVALRNLPGLACGVLLAACSPAPCPEPTTTPTTTGGERPDLFAELASAPTLTVEVDATNGVLDERHVFAGFGCSGGNHSPAIRWSGLPEGTQSVLVEIHDPDAPTGVGFFHWLVADLAPSTTELPYDAAASGMPEGSVQTRTDFGTTTYGGPCPPPGAPHRYVVTVYALDVPSLGVDASTSPAVVRFSVRGHTLAYGRATATYGR